MVRLKCEACNHIWNETAKQTRGLHVFCSKCGDLHHSHSQPIIPNKPFVVNKDTADETKEQNRKKGKMINEPDTFSLRQLGVVDGQVKGYALGYRTKEIGEKDKNEDKETGN